MSLNIWLSSIISYYVNFGQWCVVHFRHIWRIRRKRSYWRLTRSRVRWLWWWWVKQRGTRQCLICTCQTVWARVLTSLQNALLSKEAQTNSLDQHQKIGLKVLKESITVFTISSQKSSKWAHEFGAAQKRPISLLEPVSKNWSYKRPFCPIFQDGIFAHLMTWGQFTEWTFLTKKMFRVCIRSF